MRESRKFAFCVNIVEILLLSLTLRDVFYVCICLKNKYAIEVVGGPHFTFGDLKSAPPLRDPDLASRPPKHTTPPHISLYTRASQFCTPAVLELHPPRKKRMFYAHVIIFYSEALVQRQSRWPWPEKGCGCTWQDDCKLGNSGKKFKPEKRGENCNCGATGSGDILGRRVGAHIGSI